MAEYLDEKLTYSRELSDAGEPTERIAEKNAFHLLDAERDALSRIAQDEGVGDPGLAGVFVSGLRGGIGGINAGRVRPAWMRRL